MSTTSQSGTPTTAPLRHDWSRAEAEALYNLPFADLVFRAQGTHRANFDPNHVETASLLSIKTGGCPEDCGYCSQSAHYDTDVKATKLAIYADPSARVTSTLRALGLPATLLIGPNGQEIGRLIGPAEWDSDDAKALIRSVLPK